MHPQPAGRSRPAAQLAAVAVAAGAAATLCAASLAETVEGPPEERRVPPTARRPLRRVPAALSPERLAGAYVGVLGAETLVLSLSLPDPAPAGASDQPMIGTLNRNTREPVSFPVPLTPTHGPVARQLPGLDVSIGSVLEDAEGRLWIALIADDGRIAAELSEIKTKSGGK